MTRREKVEAAAALERTAREGYRVQVSNAVFYASRAAGEFAGYSTAGELAALRAAVELLVMVERKARARVGVRGDA